jgi:ribosomal protein S18 acetylase RimI-like enzyme
MSVSVEIGPAKKRDLRGILALIRDYKKYDVEFANRYYDIYFKRSPIVEKDKVYVAKLEGKTIGVIGFSRDYFSTDYSYWLGWFVVDKKYRGRKDYAVAKKLLKEVESELAKRRIKKLFVDADDTNKRAKSFYAKNGFRTEAVLRDYYYKGEDQLILSKVLITR